MKTMLRFFTAGLFILCLSGLFGEEPRPPAGDAEISQKLLHIWSVYAVWAPADVPNHFDGTEVFTADGKFITKGIFTIVNDKRPMEAEGTWQVKDGFLIDHYQKQQTQSDPRGPRHP